MKPIIAAMALGTALSGCSNSDRRATPAQSAQKQRLADADTERYMRQAETEWTVAPLNQRPALLKRILADDYVGVGTKGAVRNKEQTIAADSAMPSNPGEAAKLDYVRYRHFGDTVLDQGRETTSSSGKARKIVWTDVWMFRNGKWQIVASQDTVLQPE